MDKKKTQMIEAEHERHEELEALLAKLSMEQILEPGINGDGWSVKDMLWHLGAWSAESANALERIGLGTYAPLDRDTDELNADFMAAGKDLDLETVKAEWLSARSRARANWDAIEEITPEAEEWFYESGAEHMDDHLPELRDWVEKQG